MRVVFLLAAACLPPATFAAVTGSIRTNFISGFERSCFETQRNSSVNNGVSSATIKSYCKCSATYLADLLNNELVRSIEAGENRLNPNLVELASTYCRKNFERF